MRRFTHDLHPWPAKFIPDIPAAAIEALTEPGDTVLDPFCGCGTTALEAVARRRKSVALDINPLAVLITDGKVNPPDPAERRMIAAWADKLRAVEADADLIERAPVIPNREYWFDAEVTAQLVSLRQEINALGISHSFLQTVFSSLIVKASRQESETRYRRVDRPRTAEWVVVEFRRRIWRALKMAQELEPLATEQAVAEVADARALQDQVSEGSVALAVFSPPYPNAFDYHLYHRFRMFWLGFDPRVVKHDEIGAHLRYQPREDWERDMQRAVSQLYRVVRVGGHVAWVVGNGVINGEVVPSGDIFWELSVEVGFKPVFRTIRPVATNRRAFNLSDTRLREEHVLVLKR